MVLEICNRSSSCQAAEKADKQTVGRLRACPYSGFCVAAAVRPLPVAATGPRAGSSISKSQRCGSWTAHSATKSRLNLVAKPATTCSPYHCSVCWPRVIRTFFIWCLPILLCDHSIVGPNPSISIWRPADNVGHRKLLPSWSYDLAP